MSQERLRAIIVDDEDLARRILREYLGPHADIEIIAECANGYEAVRVMTEQKPDLVFLDIQMPKLNGFEVLDLAGYECAIVLVTAYDQYAIKAFDIHAVDYLLKPFSQERFEKALVQVRKHMKSPARPLLAEIAEAARPPGRKLDRILIKDGTQVHVIPVSKIDHIEAQDDYVCICAEGKKYLKQQRLSVLEQVLDPARFIRIHRSVILNIDRLARIELYAKDSRMAVLKDRTQLPVSRRGYERLRRFL
jgi:two-component system LytT family response regulator